MQSAAHAEAPASAVVPILKPGFTALSNALIDSGLLSQLKPTELTLFLILCRFSTGFLRLRAIIGESKLVELTGASPSTLYEAKKGLVQRGLITISHTRAGRCCYTLAKHLQPVLADGETPEPVTRPTWASPSGQPSLLPSRESESIKSSKKSVDHHSSSGQPSPQNDDELLHLCSEPVGGPKPPEGPSTNYPGLLVAQLKQMGVNEIMAHRLVKRASDEVIRNALARVKTLQTSNPAGYLVSEISRGGYQAKPDATKAIRLVHQEIHEKRQLEKRKVEQQRETAKAKADRLWQNFEGLPVARQDELKRRVNEQASREGFSRLPGWGEGHPAWRGLLQEMMEGMSSSLEQNYPAQPTRWSKDT